MAKSAVKEAFEITDRRGRIIRGMFRGVSGAKRTLILIHGFSEHKGVFTEVAERLTALQNNVVVFDLPGFGESEGIRTHINEFEEYTDAAEQVYQYVQGRSRMPVFLMGNSMGAMICLFLSLRMPDIKGLILIAPYIDLPPFKKVLYKTLTDLAYSLFGASFSTQAIFSYDNLTTDHAQRAYYQQDPYRSKNITAGFSRAMFKQLPADKHLPDLPAVPVLMVNSGSDRIVDVCAAQRLFHRFPHPDKTLAYYTSCRHDLLHDRYRDDIVRLCMSWLSERT